MLTKQATITAIVLAVLLFIGLWVMGNYNSLVSSKNQVDKSWSKVETQYQRRFDLIGNLVESVKGSQLQEQKVYGEIAQARTQYAGAKSTSEQAQAASNMESALGRLLVITENYPELKSNQNMIALQGELAKTENEILTARNGYNDTATNYNTGIQRFPKNLFANWFGFEKQNLFKADVGASKAPQVKF